MENKYVFKLRILHWSIATLIFLMLIIGFTMTSNNIDKETKSILFKIHESFGVTILLLVSYRLIIRFTSHIPALPEKIAKIYRTTAVIVHYFLYCLMITLPVTGIFGAMYQGYNVYFYGINLPIIVNVNQIFGKKLMQTHEFLPYIIILFITLHIAGFLKHQFIDKIDIFSRISLKK